MSTELTEVRDGPTNPLALIQLALERGVDPGKLLDLAERWEEIQARKAYNEGMVRTQKRVSPVVKSAKGQNNYYAPLEAVLKVARPIWIEEGFSVSSDTADSHLPDHYRVVLHVSHVGGETRHHHIDLPRDGAGPKGGSTMNPVQGVISSFSYGDRVLICRVFNIVLEGMDQDGRLFVSSVDENQLAEITKALWQSGRDVKRFLEWCSTKCGAEIVALEQVPAAFYAQAMSMLTKAQGGK